jgi:5-methylcytosine-specific restriction endonuclease McrA
MTDTESRSNDETTESTESNDDARTERFTPQECHETVDPEKREEVLDEYGSRCQVCGRCGPAKGGLATLHVHHIERDPDEMDEHDIENLTLLCRSCHSWFHQQSTPDDAPVEITEEDQTVLLRQDIEILQYLAESGPARTGDIVSAVPTDLSVSAVRARLWVLMGLDNLVETRDRQIVDKDTETGEWGLTDQIEVSARGYIPDDQQLLLQRMEDEQVRQALERDCDRSAVTAVFGISRRTTFNKVKRAYAYDFPLEAFERGGRPTNDVEQPAQPSTGDDVDAESDADGQQRLDGVDSDGDDLGRTETWGQSDATTDEETTLEMHRDDDAQSPGDDTADIHRELQAAIEALEAIDSAL